MQYLYDAQGVCAIVYQGDLYTLCRGVDGSVLRIIAGSEVLCEYDYDAWGNCKERLISIHDDDIVNITPEQIADELFVLYNNPFRWKSCYYDKEAGLYYINGRHYSPELMQFLQPDLSALNPEKTNGLDLYCFANNNPVNHTQDPVFSIGIYTSDNVLSGSVGSSRVNWKNGGFQIPVWISSLMSGSDFGASIAPALRTIYQYIRYPGVKDLNKLYGLDFVPGKLNTVSSMIGYVLLGLNIGLSAWSNFTNDNLTTKQQWISFGVDTAYTLGTFGIGYGVGALVSLIPGVGVFIAPFASAGVAWFIDWINEKWSWLDDVKQWFNDL